MLNHLYIRKIITSYYLVACWDVVADAPGREETLSWSASRRPELWNLTAWNNMSWIIVITLSYLLYIWWKLSLESEVIVINIIKRYQKGQNQHCRWILLLIPIKHYQKLLLKQFTNLWLLSRYLLTRAWVASTGGVVARLSSGEVIRATCAAGPISS